MSKIEKAQALLAEMANAETNAMAERLVREGICFWRGDPDYPDVVGLVHRDNPDDAAVLVYLDGDFEVAGRYEQESYTGEVTPR